MEITVGILDNSFDLYCFNVDFFHHLVNVIFFFWNKLLKREMNK